MCRSWKLQSVFSVVLLCFHASASEYLEGPSEYNLRVELYNGNIMDNILLNMDLTF